jgi:predicted nucleic acid-binding Zn ribbon protein
MERISTLLFGLYRGTPRHNDWVVACLEGMWAGLLGERIAQACRPAGFRNARLTIQILNPAWTEPLREMERDLLLRIGGATGNEVRHLVFEVDAHMQSTR